MPENVHFGENSKIEGKKVKTGKSIEIGKNTIIKGKKIFIEDNVVIADNIRIFSENISIGFNSKIEDNCQIILSGENSKFSIGDNCFIGYNSKIIVPVFEAGDYVVLHNHLLVNGYKPCLIGYNVWIGQNCVLNSSEMLTIGNGVGIGTYSCVWTHGGHGELLEGCNINKTAPVAIEDDAWLVGAFNVVSPGVTIGKKSVILTGSVVTKNISPFACVSGNPARDITDKISTYRKITTKEKFEMMKKFIDEFIEIHYKNRNEKLENGWRIKDDEDTHEIQFLQVAEDKSMNDDLNKVIFTKKNLTTKEYKKVSIFDISTKKYTKRRTRIEIEVIKFLLYSKARFYPL